MPGSRSNFTNILERQMTAVLLQAEEILLSRITKVGAEPRCIGKAARRWNRATSALI